MREISIIEDEEEHHLLDVSLEDHDSVPQPQPHHQSQSHHQPHQQPTARTLFEPDDSLCSSTVTNPTTRNRRLLIAIIMIALLAIIGSSFVTKSGSDLTQQYKHHQSTPKIATAHIVDVNGPPEGIGAENAASSDKSFKSKIDHEAKHNKKDKKNKKKLKKFNTGVSRHTRTAAIASDDEDYQQLLVIHNDDDQVPTGIVTGRSGGNLLHASDALECRESVISFVINATDGKDECDGLKRAFDKTCNSDESEVNKQATPTEAAEKTEKTEQQSFQDDQRRRRQLLFAASQPETIRQRLQVLMLQTSRWIHTNLVEPLSMHQSSPLAFFAEEELSGHAWQDAQFLVDNDLDGMVYAKLSRRLKSEAKDDRKHEEEQDAHDMISKKKKSSKESGADQFGEEAAKVDDDKEEEQEIIMAATKVPKAVADKPKLSLTMPTLNQHISGTMLSETLLLQKEDTVKIAIKAAANYTNTTTAPPATTTTTMSEAAVDAVASKKAVQDTSAAVSAVLNDPTSVEARTCCASILNVFHENCDTPDEEMVSDKKLFLIVFVIALCGMVKSLIRFYQIRWLPEAAGCILVGVACGAVMSFVPHYDVSFDGDWFLRIMVPPIVFEAALSIDKRSFNRHIWPIIIYAVIGTLMATGMTAFILHKGTSMLAGCETIPYVESLAFGALISSIDPIAVLSVLSNMGMTDTDTIYVVIFGESLLNDGVALVLFSTLVHFLDESLVIDTEAVIAAASHFLVVAIGSLCVGIGSGVACTLYYSLMQGCQTPLVEVLLFFCWAFIPYYICDGIGWSGIVAVVATGFVVDLYVVGQAGDSASALEGNQSSRLREGSKLRRDFFSTQGYLSSQAKTHVHFVAELLATMMETAIFAYLGVFLFGYRYHWNFLHTFLAIFACCASRAVMIPLLSLIANWVAKIQRAAWTKKTGRRRIAPTGSSSASASQPPPGVIIDNKMQLVLWVAGLRGAMSFALVETIPLYDTVTGEGSKVKPELKAMTSATIVFTVFVLGGYTYYLMDSLGMTPSQSKHASTSETNPLVKRSSKAEMSGDISVDEVNHPTTVRHRLKDKIVAY